MLKNLPIVAMLALAACAESDPPQVTIVPASLTIDDPRTWQEELNGEKPETPPIKPVMITRVYDFDYANDHTWKECLQ